MPMLSYYVGFGRTVFYRAEDSLAALKIIEELRKAPIDLDVITLDNVPRCIWTLERVQVFDEE